MGFLSNLLSGKSHHESINISKTELEDIIVAALVKAHNQTQAQESKSENEAMTDSVKFMLYVMSSVFLLFWIVTIVMSIISFFPNVAVRMESMEAFMAAPLILRILMFIGSIVYGWFGVQLIVSIRKEKDRAFLMAYISAITSTVALIVALMK